MAKSATSSFTSTMPDPVFAARLDRDHKRAQTRRRKYAYGQKAWGPGSDRLRPVPQDHFSNSNGTKCGNRAPNVRRNASCKTAYLDEPMADARQLSVLEDTDAWNETLEAIREPQRLRLWDVDGPATGQYVLGEAVDRAVAQFENKVTETLVRDEYAVINTGAEADEHDSQHEEEDEDFELV